MRARSGPGRSWRRSERWPGPVARPPTSNAPSLRRFVTSLEGKLVGQPLQFAAVAERHPTRDLRQSMRDATGDHFPRKKERKNNASRVLIVGALMRPAGQEPAEDSELYYRPLNRATRRGSSFRSPRTQDGPLKSGPCQRRAHHGNCEDARLRRAWHALSGVERRGDDGLRPRRA